MSNVVTLLHAQINGVPVLDAEGVAMGLLG